MKKVLFFAVAAALFAACSSKDDIASQAPTAPVGTTGDQAVSFDSYLQRGVTRSGDTGTMTTDQNYTRKLQDTGFGVFGYYTDNNEYDGQTIPNFFYNQKIDYNISVTGKWGYSPVKYWPNEYGSSAIADDNDKVSYFAYAPYVTVAPSSGKAQDQTFGITQLSRNSATGDPYVKYIASFDWTKNVDLLWGVVPTDKTTWDIVSGEQQTMTAGLPWLNVERPAEAATQETANQRVKFDFKHALAKLNVVVDYDADEAAHNDVGNEINVDHTRIYIRSVSFTGFAMQGALNLNNVTPGEPLWLAYDAQSDLETGEEIVVNDGRKDGREGTGGAVATNEKNVALNPALIQEGTWNSDNKGVLKNYQNLFAFPGARDVATDLKGAHTGKINASALAGFTEALGVEGTTDWDYTTSANQEAMLNWPVMVIPTGEEMKVTIVYDVETVDAQLASMISDGVNQGVSIPNTITKTITFGGDKNYLEAGKKYVVRLHIGMNSVKFDAEVTDWETTAIEADAWLPSNATSYQAPGVYNYSVIATKTGASDAFTLTGFSPNELVEPTPSKGTAGTANASGTVTGATLTGITPNASVLNVTTDNYATFTGSVSGKAVVINLVQLADQPDATESTLAISSTTGTFALKNASGDALSGAKWTGPTRNVQILSAYRNGVVMTEVDESATPSGSLQFKTSGNPEDATITIGSTATTGEVFIFTIKAGDSAPVTIKCTVS